MSIKTKKNTTITSDKEIKVKGKKIKMSGSKGVTAEGKQIAVEGDKVMGMDTHIMVVPAGNTTTTVPLPHPFIGKLKDKLAKDVTIKDKKCAVKDSVAKHDDSMHMQLPGTIKFQNNPKKEGKVTGGTSSKVKIEGKEAAVIGSQVTTCNDMGMQNNSTIIAMGASIPMPAIINPKNTEEYERERREAENKNPKFSSVKWSKTRGRRRSRAYRKRTGHSRRQYGNASGIPRRQRPRGQRSNGKVPTHSKRRKRFCKMEVPHRPERDAAGERPEVCIHCSLCLV